MSLIWHFCLCHALYTADVLFLLRHLCRFTVVFGLSVLVTAKEISSPVGYTKQVFDNSIKAIFVLEKIFCGQNLIKMFWKPGLFFFLIWNGCGTESLGAVTCASRVWWWMIMQLCRNDNWLGNVQFLTEITYSSANLSTLISTWSNLELDSGHRAALLVFACLRYIIVKDK